jgi:hypothetical protein
MERGKMTPKETDTKLAEIWAQIYKVEHRLASTANTLQHTAGAKFYYRGRQYVCDMTVSEAIEILTAAAEYIADYIATHQKPERDGWVGTDWDEFECVVAPYDKDKPAKYLAQHAELIAELEALHQQADELEASYTGWSRFFLVTSSAGHVHSSMHCSTCRPTTQYGWLPELSGKTEDVAVDELGPTLCSVCFSSAPVDWTTGKKLTAAQAARKAA